MKLMVAFASPKRSRKIVLTAQEHAKALNAEVVLVRVIADPSKVGIIAELIASDNPKEKAQAQIDQVVGELKAQGVNASGILKIGAVAETLVKTAIEIQADAVYLSSGKIKAKALGFPMQDPIMHYMVDRCPVSLFITRDDYADSDR